MNTRILIIEDNEDWQTDLKAILSVTNAQITVCSNYSDAIICIREYQYDLITFDLLIPKSETSSFLLDEKIKYGQELLEIMRTDSAKNKDTAAIVISAAGGWKDIIEVFRRYQIVDYFDKGGSREGVSPFSPKDFARTAQNAMVDTLITRSIGNISNTIDLIVELNLDGSMRCEVEGRDAKSDLVDASEFSDFARRVKNINLLLHSGKQSDWRDEARGIGKALYRTLMTSSEFREAFVVCTSRAASHGKYFRLIFSTYANGFFLPFELLHDGNEYLLQNYSILRYMRSRAFFGHRLTFAGFIQSSIRNQTQLRILIIGSNSDGRIPKAEYEAIQVRERLSTILSQLNITPKPMIRLMVGAEANYEDVVSELLSQQYHIIHYAGHGRFGDEIPETSSIILKSNNKTSPRKELNTNDLRQLLSQHSEPPKLFFLSCCLGAESQENRASGEYYGIYDALARSGVTTTIGYKWTVKDEPAATFAEEFYELLFYFFDVSRALDETRKIMARKYSLNNETWLSPILMDQTIK